MNIDLAAGFNFGDRMALRTFFMDHRFIHEQTAAAITKKFRIAVSVFGIDSDSALTAWEETMSRREPLKSVSLRDWLVLHSDLHNQTYTLLTSSSSTAIDLTTVDFSQPQQFYDWMYAHQQLHDFEQQQLGLK